jgi:hypothetical protein
VQEIARLLQQVSGNREKAAKLSEICQGKLLMEGQYLPAIDYPQDAENDTNSMALQSELQQETPTDYTDQLYAKFKNFMEKNQELAASPIQAVEEFVSREVETWMDAALMKELINRKIKSIKGIQELFGENTNLSTRYSNFNERRSGRELMEATQVAALVSTLLLFTLGTQKTFQETQQGQIIIYLTLAICALATLTAASLPINGYVHPQVDTKQFIKKYYRGLKVPPVARKTAAEIIRLQMKINELEKITDSSKKIIRLKNLAVRVQNLAAKIQDNSSILSEQIASPIEDADTDILDTVSAIETTANAYATSIDIDTDEPAISGTKPTSPSQKPEPRLDLAI